jgi:eukaryotic-like serine/threonine-protein kinase
MQGTHGDSLQARLNGKPLGVDQVLEIGGRIADALDALHRKGVVHGDIKPSSIRIAADNRVSLDEPGAPGANYLSPEQVRGEKLDARSDLFSFGAVLYEMATGRQAFRGDTMEAIHDAVLNREPVPVREVNPLASSDLDYLIARALEKDRAKRYERAADISSALTRLQRESTIAPAAAQAVQAAPRKSNALLIAIPVLVVLAAVGYFFWRASQPPDFKERDSIVIADFLNSTGDPVFDDGLRQLVTVMFQQTPYVTVVADQSVARQLRVMARPVEEPLTGETVREVCRQTGAKASVEGSIAPQGSGYVVAISLLNCQAGTTIAGEDLHASSKDDVLDQTGAAVLSLRKQIGEPDSSLQKYNVSAAAATTSSIDALKAYSDGLKARQTKGDEGAVPLFQKAIQIDPDFALAHARLGAVASSMGRTEDARTSMQKAYALRDRVTEYERLYISWSYAQRVTLNMSQARSAMEMMTATYPRDFTARNNLGVQLMGLGLFEEALKQYLVAQEIAPDEPLPVSNGAYALLFLGRLDEALPMIERALVLRQDPNLAITRWVMARVHGHPRAAEFEGLARSMATPPQMLFAESNLAVWEGRLHDYSQIVEKLRTEVRASPDPDALQGLDAAEVITMAVVQGGSWTGRLRSLAKQPLPPTGLAQVASALAITGQMDVLRSLAPQLDKADLNDPQQAQPLMVARALLAGSSGQIKEAEAMVDAYLVDHPRSMDLHYYLGKIREQSGRTDDAIASYRKAADAVNILGPSPAVVGARLSLAMLLKKKGDVAGANALFDQLTNQWKNADPDFEPLKTVQKNR